MARRIDAFLIAFGVAADELAALPWRGPACMALAVLIGADGLLAALNLSHLLGS